MCADRDEARRPRRPPTWSRAEGGGADVVVADVRDEAGVRRAGGRRRRAGAGRRLDGVVLNVGIGRGGGLADTTAADWDTVFAVNLRSHFLVAQAAAPHVPEGGAFVFVSSLAGLQPGSRSPAYDASKAGLIGLSRHVALEGARRGVRSNVIAPGLIDTPLGRNATRGPPVAGPHAGAARTSGHGLGGGVGDRASCCRTRPATSPARSWPSTAACASSEVDGRHVPWSAAQDCTSGATSAPNRRSWSYSSWTSRLRNADLDLVDAEPGQHPQEPGDLLGRPVDGPADVPAGLAHVQRARQGADGEGLVGPAGLVAQLADAGDGGRHAALGRRPAAATRRPRSAARRMAAGDDPPTQIGTRAVGGPGR